MKTRRNAAKTGAKAKDAGVKTQALAGAAALEPALTVGAESTAAAVAAAVLEDDDARPPRDLILGSKCPRLRAWLAARGDSTAEASTKAGLA